MCPSTKRCATQVRTLGHRTFLAKVAQMEAFVETLDVFRLTVDSDRKKGRPLQCAPPRGPPMLDSAPGPLSPTVDALCQETGQKHTECSSSGVETVRSGLFCRQCSALLPETVFARVLGGNCLLYPLGPAGDRTDRNGLTPGLQGTSGVLVGFLRRKCSCPASLRATMLPR